jgi:hypothetical protein
VRDSSTRQFLNSGQDLQRPNPSWIVFTRAAEVTFAAIPLLDPDAFANTLHSKALSPREVSLR